jgi:multidrug efflux system membrane fusion protein
VENAELQLKDCSIRSPVDGRVGNLLVDEGNLVKANDVVLVIINQIHPIEVSFCVPQSDLPGIRRYMARGKLAVRALVPKEESDGEDGELTFVDNAVEKGTGTVQLRATFQNPRERLWPGLYVQVILTLAVQDDAIVAASRAIQTGRDGKYVFVVKSDGTVEMRGVKVSRAVGRETVVDEGLQAGERVVTDGHLRLIDGTKVEVQGEAKTQPASQRTGV